MSDQTAQGSGGYGEPDSPPVSGKGLGGVVPPGVTRRGLLRVAGAGAAVVGGGGLLEACSSSIKGASSSSSSSSSSSATAGGSTQPIVIGFIHPLTGPLGEFGTSDDWIVSTIQATPQYKNGIKVGGKTYPVTIKSYDTQSDPTKAGQLASQAILTDKVDLIVTSSTPETVNPVATVAEKLGTPTICGNVPWQAWYANLGGNPTPGKSTFKPVWTTMYFLGVNDLCNAFIPMWNKIHAQLSTDKVAGCMFPNDSDGNAFRAAWPLFAGPAGYTLVDPPPYTDGLTNYSSFISEFKSKNCEFFTNVPLPPDFNTFWKQAAQQGYKPKLATVAKVLLFPSDVNALGSLVNNVATDAWWTPNMPWKSSLTGQTCAQIAAAFTSATGSQWVQSLSNYSLFEVAYAAMTSVNNPHDKTEVAAALFKVNIEGVAGQLDWTSSKNPAPGVVDTPCVGVQWKPNSKYGWSMEVVDNTLMPEVALTSTLEPTNK
ncbi:MAG TPA: ABC transporter substrate-binding protein [Streptosporangiaceae bacterium]|nr:ABC transporter substrate-binding protein [Streptosporangiaceae bacterium]